MKLPTDLSTLISQFAIYSKHEIALREFIWYMITTCDDYADDYNHVVYLRKKPGDQLVQFYLHKKTGIASMIHSVTFMRKKQGHEWEVEMFPITNSSYDQLEHHTTVTNVAYIMLNKYGYTTDCIYLPGDSHLITLGNSPRQTNITSTYKTKPYRKWLDQKNIFNLLDKYVM